MGADPPDGLAPSQWQHARTNCALEGCSEDTTWFGSQNWSSIAEESWTSREHVKRVCTWEKQSISVASSVITSVFIRVVDAGNPVKLNGIIFRYRWDASSHLPNLRENFLSRCQWGFQFFRVKSQSAIGFWQRIEKRIPRFFLGDNFPGTKEGYNALGVGIPDVLGGGLHVPRMKTLLYVTDKRLEELRGAAVDYERRVLYLHRPFSLESLPDIDSEDGYASRYCDAFRDPLDLFCSTSRFPVLPKALLFLLSGFLCSVAGFAGLFSCLSFRSSWKQIAGTLMVAVFGIFVFHIGIFYLLK